MTGEIWVLGATGRTGRAIGERLAARGDDVVLVGRDEARLRAVAGRLRTVRAVSAAEAGAAFAASAPAGSVVVNTIGPFATTAPQVLGALPPGAGYVDLSNELGSIQALLAGAEAATRGRRCLVTGAGFGVLGSESAALRLRAARDEAPRSVRVDAISSWAAEAGRLGEALAASLVDGLPAGGARYAGGHVVRAPVSSAVQALTTPDGDAVRTGLAPFGELEAAHRATGAPDVVSASSELPTGLPVRIALPVVSALLRSARLRAFARRRLAAVEIKAAPPARAHSWARAHATWADGTSATVWLRAGDGMAFTADVAAEVAHRLVRGEGRPGAFTPGALFGPELALALGASFLDA